MRLNIFDWDYAQSKDDNKKEIFYLSPELV